MALRYTHDYGRARIPRRLDVSDLQHVIRVRRGTDVRVLEPGRHRLRPRIDRLWIESATPHVMTVPGQEVLTADGVTVKATVTALVQVVDPLAARNAGDWRSTLHVDIQLALRSLVAAASLEVLVASRSALDEPLLAIGRTAAEPLGVHVDRVALRDLVVPGEQRRMLSEVVAARLAGQASLEKARAETAALRNLANAASLMRDNPEIYQLRLLQEMASSSGHTFVVGTEPTIPRGRDRQA